MASLAACRLSFCKMILQAAPSRPRSWSIAIYSARALIYLPGLLAQMPRWQFLRLYSKCRSLICLATPGPANLLAYVADIYFMVIIITYTHMRAQASVT